VSRALKAYIAGLVSVSAIALVATSLVIPVDGCIAPGAATPLCLVPEGISPLAGEIAGIAFWTLLTLVMSALPVQLPNGTSVSVATAPIVAAMLLGGPTAAGWVAVLGATEMRELRGQVPWYGTLVNHAGIALPAILGGLVLQGIQGVVGPGEGFLGVLLAFLGAIVGATVVFALNLLFASTTIALRTGERLSMVIRSGAQLYWNLATLAPLAWLMQQMYLVAWWASLLFALPLYTTRVAYHRFVEMREMFTQTIGALAEAVDARDKFTSNHSRRVMTMSVDIGRIRKVSAADLDALEWGGLLHDVGKIGVPDAVLLKPDRLTKEERAVMNAHPVMGANIIGPVTKLAPVVPLILHHHEWFNGSGYPDRLVGMEIPELARILAVADAFEAMTAARPYRMSPLTRTEALAELRRFAGIQFDPQMVEAFAKTEWVRDVPDPARPNDVHPVPLLRDMADRLATATTSPEPTSPAENS
jgi:hypothetical protein